MVTEGEHGGFLERGTPRPMAFLLQITMFGCEFFQAVIGPPQWRKEGFWSSPILGHIQM